MHSCSSHNSWAALHVSVGSRLSNCKLPLTYSLTVPWSNNIKYKIITQFNQPEKTGKQTCNIDIQISMRQFKAKKSAGVVQHSHKLHNYFTWQREQCGETWQHMPNTKCMCGEEQWWGVAAQTGTDGHSSRQMLQTLTHFSTAQDVQGAPRRTEGKVFKKQLFGYKLSTAQIMVFLNLSLLVFIYFIHQSLWAIHSCSFLKMYLILLKMEVLIQCLLPLSCWYGCSDDFHF